MSEDREKRFRWLTRWPIKTWLKITMAIILPMAMINISVLIFYSSVMMCNGIDEARQDILSVVLQKAESIRKGIDALIVNTNTLAGLLAQNEEPISEYARAMLENSNIQSGIRIEYDPEFLAEIKAGKYPDFHLENHFDLLSSDEIPDFYCAKIFRDKTGAFQIIDESKMAYPYWDSFLLPKLLRRGCWIDPYVSGLIHELVCAYSTPFYYKGHFAGSISVSFLVDDLLKTDTAGFDMSLPKDSLALYILADNGKVIFSVNLSGRAVDNIYSLVPENREADLFPALDQILSNQTGEVRTNNWGGEYGATWENGIDIWTVYTPVERDTGWILATVFDEKVVLQTLHHRIFIVWCLGIGSLLIMTGITTFLFILIYSPVLSLSDVSEQIAMGDENAAVPERYLNKRTSLGRLAINFTNMVASLRENTEKAKNELIKRQGIEKELAVAQQVQRTLLPKKTSYSSLPACEMDAVLIPARFVAGDFYDCWKINDRLVAFLIGDVSGKGVSAALIMAATRATIRQLTTPDANPGDIITATNRQLQENNARYMFSTLFFAIYDSKTGQIQCTNAGHCPPALLHRDGTVEELNVKSGTVVGVFPDSSFENIPIQLEPGETIFLCTDGVFDAGSATGERFERKRFEDLLANQTDRPIAEILQGVVAAIENFSIKDKRDDITLIGFRRKLE